MPFKSDNANDAALKPTSDYDQAQNLIQDLFKMESNVSWSPYAAKQAENNIAWLTFEPLQIESDSPRKWGRPIIRDDESSPEYKEALRRSAELVSEKVDRSGEKSFVVDEKGLQREGLSADKSDMQKSAFDEINRSSKESQKRSHDADGHHDKSFHFQHGQLHIPHGQLHIPGRPHVELLVPHSGRPHLQLHIPHHGDHSPAHGGGHEFFHQQMQPQELHLPVKPNDHATPSEHFAPSPNLDIANTRFEKALAGMSPKQQETFRKSRAEMIEGCHERGLSNKEITETLDQVTRLLETKSHVLNPKYEEHARELAALGILRNTTQPDYYCNQGHHGTCNVTAVEERSFNNNPSRAAQIIADSLINGRFTSLDGKEVVMHPDALRPDLEARNGKNDGSNQRSYASQIFQASVLSDLGSRNNPPVLYIANGGPGAAGDGWINPINGQKFAFTGANMAEIEKMNHSVNGDYNVVKEDFKTPAELEKWIRDNEAKQPLILCVDSKDPLFYNHTTSDGKLSKFDHVVSIREYDPVHHRVRVSNQWGSKMDFWVDINVLQQAT
ncbi:MAG: hypothetical protein JST89_00235 [Cyanobacteria bacterium SZAS-4]|nr:hypothetical protein [Cyanobacteria bacterium SZAS-4]